MRTDDGADGLRSAVLAAVARFPGAVVAGTTAAALHGAIAADDRDAVTHGGGADPIELTRDGGGIRTGSTVVVRRDHLVPDEVVECEISGGTTVRVTSPARTAFDVGRRLPTVDAVVAIEALVRGQGTTVEEVRRMAAAHSYARGLPRLRAALDLIEPGARSAFESRVRIALLLAGIPGPVVGHVVVAGDQPWGVTDLAWPRERCALLCDRDLPTARLMAGLLVLDRWTVQTVSRERWATDPDRVIENVGHMVRANRRDRGLDLPVGRRGPLGWSRPRRRHPKTVPVFD